MISIKKKISYIQFAFIATVLLSSCEAREWDPAEDLSGLTEKWSEYYVDRVYKYKVIHYDTLGSYVSAPIKYTISSLKDTLSIGITHRTGDMEGDSIYVISKFLQIKDSMIVTVDGYRYSEKFWAHLYTTGDGIVNSEGVFRVDFYETGKTVPWAWSEIRYRKSFGGYSYKKDATKTAWY